MRLYLYLMVPVLALIPELANPQEPSSAGRIVMTVGTVAIRTSTGSTTTNPARGNAVLSGSTVSTAEDAHVQVRMSDGAMLSLACSSTLSINDYEFTENAASSRANLNLQAGRVRMIAGEIAEQDSAAFHFNTQEIAVSTSGADFEIWIDPATNTVYAAVFQGAITLTNDIGALTLGIGGNQGFAVIRPGESPAGINQRPTRPC